MILSQKIAAAVERLGTGTPASVVVEHESLQFLIDVAQAGPVGLLVSGIQARNTSFDDPAVSRWSMDELRARGERLASKVTYLMEPLKLIEMDSIAQDLELRSVDPTKRTERASFYQAKLSTSAHFSMKRVSFSEADRQRRPVDMQLTGETLERLADDVAATLS